VKQYLIVLCFLAPLVFLGGGYAVVGQDNKPAEKKGPKTTQDDLVHFGDVIDIDVVGSSEFDWRGTLTPDGYLDGLDGYNEPIYAFCRTESEIAADVARSLGKILREPKIVVRVIDRSNRAVVRLDGAVRSPTRFRLLRTTYLKELLVLAGGLTDSSSGEVTIFRPKNLSCQPAIIQASQIENGSPPLPRDNGSSTLNIKISELLSGSKAANPQIFSGDLINVERATLVYVIGAVKSPRPVYYRSQATLSRVIASAGGLSKDADGGRILIYRRDGNESRVIEANLVKIGSGESVDEVLKPFDIIEVAARGGVRRKYPPVIAAGEIRDQFKRELPLRVVD
jgi:protein involved in polysaccharide export with SLBB domain